MLGWIILIYSTQFCIKKWNQKNHKSTLTAVSKRPPPPTQAAVGREDRAHQAGTKYWGISHEYSQDLRGGGSKNWEIYETKPKINSVQRTRNNKKKTQPRPVASASVMYTPDKHF